MLGNSKLPGCFFRGRNTCKFLARKTLHRQSAAADVHVALPFTESLAFGEHRRWTFEISSTVDKGVGRTRCVSTSWIVISSDCDRKSRPLLMHRVRASTRSEAGVIYLRSRAMCRETRETDRRKPRVLISRDERADIGIPGGRIEIKKAERREGFEVFACEPLFLWNVLRALLSSIASVFICAL